MFIIGIDIGGTFTDVVVFDSEAGRQVEVKSPSTPGNLSAGVFNGLQLAAEELGISVPDLLSRTRKFAHATTQTSNVVFTFMGAKVGLLTTRGFEDHLVMMRGIGRVAGLSLMQRRHPRATDKPEPIVDETLTRGIVERMDWQGDVVVSLDEAQARQAIKELLAEGVEAIAVSLLWSFKNPAHERRLLEIIREMAPDIHVSLSSELVPVRGEYERTATTVMNAYVAPTLNTYLENLQRELQNAGLQYPMLVVQANGGVVLVDQVTPIQTIESGPAVGVIAARSIADDLGLKGVIATDVGGTTFKVSVLGEDEWATAKETVIGQYGLRLPMVDVASIGAGGGSIAWTDQGRLHVGPASAQADPGPVAYGRGGQEPTVTDVDLLLGYLNPDYFWGGRLQLDVAAARQALGDRVADTLFAGDTERAAAGVRQIVDHHMADLIRKTTVERGFDPRDFVMFAYGGMGPLHGASLAREAGIHKVLIPTAAPVLSAYGAATSDIVHSLETSDLVLLPARGEEVARHYRAMEEQADVLLEQEGVAPGDRRFRRWVDMRYRRQMHEVRVDVPNGPLSDEDVQRLSDNFEAKYEQLYGAGAAYREAGIEMVTFGVEAVGTVLKPTVQELPTAGEDASAALKGSRRMYCPRVGEWLEGRVYEGERLRPGNRFAGLAVVEYAQTTVLVESGQTAQVDGRGNILIEVGV